MSEPPSKLEILLKYRDVIEREDFDILIADELPTPEIARQEGSFLMYLGKVKDWRVFLKRTVGGAVAVICFLGGGFIPGLEYVRDYSTLAYKEVNEYLATAMKRDNQPATEYVTVERPDQWALPSDEPLHIVTTTTTQPPNTTTKSERGRDLPPGSGFVPYSGSWQGWT